MIFKLEKIQKKRKTHGKSKSKTSKLKKNGSKIKEEKKARKKGKKTFGKKWICQFAFILLSRFAFVLLLFCFFLFAWKKAKKQQNKSTKKANRKQTKCKKNANGQVHFFPLFDFPFFPFCSPFILLLCFF
jgi:ATP-dependent Zn protease